MDSTALYSLLASIGDTEPAFALPGEMMEAAVLALLIPFPDGVYILFEKRSGNVSQPGEIALPGGRRASEDEPPAVTALRELHEETGIEPDRVSGLSRLTSVIAPMGAVVHAFAASAQISCDEMRHDPAEVAALFLLPLSFFMNTEPEEYQVRVTVDPCDENGNTIFPARTLGLPERYTRPWSGRRSTVLVYHTEQGVLWGITARIIRDLVLRLRKAGYA